MRTLIVLVCGSRDWTDASYIEGVLGFLEERHTLTVIEGGAVGADRTAGRWAAKARQRGVGWVRFPADWGQFGRSAGPIRNQQMLDYGPHLVLAFKDGFDWGMRRGGTEDMVRRATAAGVPAVVFPSRSC